MRKRRVDFSDKRREQRRETDRERKDSRYASRIWGFKWRNGQRDVLLRGLKDGVIGEAQQWMGAGHNKAWEEE